MKKIIIIGFIVLFGFLLTKFFYIKDEAKTYHAGYMYWSHPSILRDKWNLLLTGTVTKVDEVKKLLNESISIADGYRKGGSLKVHERETVVLQDAELWKKYDAKGLAYRLEALKFLKEEKK